MKTEHFQRYHEKENLPLVNTALLLRKLYSYSPQKFYNLLNNLSKSKNISLGPNLEFREYVDNYSESMLTFSQPSFKISIETNLNNMFVVPMFSKHLNVFSDEKLQLLITLGSQKLAPSIYNSLKNTILQYNKQNNTKIIHSDLTYNTLILEIKAVLSKYDEFLDILEDYKNYCISQDLIKLQYPL